MARVLLTFEPSEAGRRAVAEGLAGIAEPVYLKALDGAARRRAIERADALMAYNIAKEFTPDELKRLTGLKLLQFMMAGVDFVPLGDVPAGVPIAVNGGAYAEAMAEHALAMALAAAKRLFIEHANLAQGEFNQFVPNRTLRGMVLGVLGMGGIGEETARLMRPMGVKVHAINRRGASAEPTDWIGTPDRLNELLAAADILLLSLPLTRVSQGMIGAAELSRMKPDAILINLARGEIVDEAALYAHLKANPQFTACIDAWWVEPVRHGRFEMAHPFLELPNVIASPHNSASVPDFRPLAIERAVANCRRALLGETPWHLIGEDERVA